MLLNISNHKFEKWTEEQKKEAVRLFNNVIDLGFPEVSPEGDEKYVLQLVEEYCKKIFSTPHDNFFDINVFIMGEQGFCYSLIRRLKEYGIRCFYSTTARIVVEEIDNNKVTKKSIFKFVRFREYV
jgi:hypothetical protein